MRTGRTVRSDVADVVRPAESLTIGGRFRSGASSNRGMRDRAILWLRAGFSALRACEEGREIERRNQQQEQLAAVGQMAVRIAQDFDNVMSNIILYSQMAAQLEGLSEQDQERMAMLNQQAQYATQLVKQTLDPSQRPAFEGQPLDVPAQAMAALAPETLPLAKGSGETILVVEDSASARRTVVASLKSTNSAVRYTMTPSTRWTCPGGNHAQSHGAPCSAAPMTIRVAFTTTVVA